MATVGVVKAIITADTTQLKKGMTDAQRSTERLGKQMSKVGKSMTMKVTAPLVGLGFAAAKMASDFEFSMTQIETLVGRSASEVETLKGAVLGLSGETGRAPKELADAMFFITSAGLDAASATAALEMSAKAAAVGLGDTSVVADAVTNAMNGYGMAADGAAFATDVLAKTVEQGKASAADLAPQFGRLIPMAAELGISFDQVGGGLAFLTRSSGDAALSATQLGGVMKSILKPSQQALKTFEEIGVDLDGLREAASTDLLGALQSLRGSLEANGKEMGDVFEDIRGLNGALMLTGEATGQAREVFDELADSSGKLDEAFRGVQKTAQFKLTQAMAGMKASMITLGEEVLPVVVPLIASLAGFIGKVATAFGNMSGPAKKISVILGVIAAAAGPVLMILGSLSSALFTLGITAGGAALSIGALLGPITAVIAVGAGLFMLFSKMGGEAKRAEERMELLTEAFIAEGDESHLLVQELDVLIARHKELAEVTKVGTEEVDNFAGSAVLMGEALASGVGVFMADLEVTTEKMNAALATGSDEFEELEKMAKYAGSTTDDKLVSALRNADDAIVDVTSALAKQFEAEVINRDELEKMLGALDKTADAYDHHQEGLDETARKYLENKANLGELEALLGADMVQSTLDAAESSGKYDLALTALKDESALVVAAQEALNTKQEQAIGVENRLRHVTGELVGVTEELEPVLLLSAEALEDIDTAAASADAAMLSFAETFSIAGKNQMKWEAEANRQAEERLTQLAAESARRADLRRVAAGAAAAQHDVDQRRQAASASVAKFDQDHVFMTNKALDLQQRALDVAETAAETAERQARADQDALDALQSQAKELAGRLRSAKQDMAKADQAVLDANRDILRAKDEQADIEDRITAFNEQQVSLGAERLLLDEDIKRISQDILDLEAEKGDFLARNVELGRAFEHEMDKARLTVIDLQRKVDDLTATRDATVDTGTAQATVNALMEQQATVNEVEQALIDLNLLKEEDAGLMDLTVKEAKTLRRLETQLRKVEKEYEDGEADLLDLMSATEDYDRAMDDAQRGSDDLRRAQKALSQAHADSIKLKEEQENIDLKLKVASEDLRLAQQKANEELQRGNAIAENDARITDLQTKLKEEQTAVTKKQTDIDAHLLDITDRLTAANADKQAAIDEVTAAERRLADAIQEQEFATVRLQRVQEELNDVQRTQNDLWQELIGLINDAGGAFRDLKDDIASGGSGGGAAASSPAATNEAAFTSSNAIQSVLDNAEMATFFEEISAKSMSQGVSGADLLARQQATADALMAGTSIEDISDFLATLGIKSAATGGFVKSAGLVNVHAGETITPAGGGATYITVNVEGSVSSERDLVESIRKGLLRSQQSGKKVVLN